MLSVKNIIVGLYRVIWSIVNVVRIGGVAGILRIKDTASILRIEDTASISHIEGVASISGIVGLRRAIVGITSIALLCVACNGNYTPKPRSYMRIKLPTSKDYRIFDSFPYPYTFEYPAYSRIVPDAQKYWLNVEFPAQNSNVYLSYNKDIPLDSNISATLFFVEKHLAKSTGIEQIYYSDFDNRIFGTVFYIKGRDVASTMQFYLTDSTRQFLRGAFYINARPNNDSLSPIINLIQDDIRHLIQTLRWR